MCDFKPGDEIVCVDVSLAGVTGWGWLYPLTITEVYVVAAVAPDPRPAPFNSEEIVVFLVGHPNPAADGSGDFGFKASRFRKVERRTDKQSLTEWLSQPSGDTDHLDKPLPTKKRERVQ